MDRDDAGLAPPEPVDLRERAAWMIARVEGERPGEAAALVEALRDAALYPPLVRLAEAVLRQRPDEHRVRRLYAQALIEQGQVTMAIDVLQRLATRLRPDHPEHREAAGLVGRCYKQLFLDSRDPHSPSARRALREALRAYRGPYERDPACTWHGVNLLALLARAERDGLPRPRGLQIGPLARQLMDTLDRVPDAQRDAWHHALRAETALALGDWEQVQAALRAYVAVPEARAFMIQGTLRQFTQVWQLEQDASGRGGALVSLLRARLLSVSEGAVELSPDALGEARRQPEPPPSMLEAVLGAEGTRTWQWWKTGIERAAAVCVVRSHLNERRGTGWLVRAADLGLTPAHTGGADQLVVTNFHVVNPDGSHDGLTPDAAEVVFEALDPGRAYAVRSVVWTSPPERHDVALLRLDAPVPATPLPLAARLPLVDPTARVYIIGHPGGRGLAYSLQDNALIDHEGPDAGRPAVPGVCRVHYRAPTEGGSSGSPVFNASDWKVIALHHSGGRIGMPRLNGQPGTYAANEGISLDSIRSALSTALSTALSAALPPAGPDTATPRPP